MEGNDIEGAVTWPVTVRGKRFPDVPKAIGNAANEAHAALGAMAPRASVAIAPAVVESTAKECGISHGLLQAKIDELAAQGHISEPMRLAAHEIRLVGNEVVHGDLVNEPISLDDANEVVALMDAILERVYQEPARVARVRASREARKKSQAVPSGASHPPAGPD